MVKAISAGLTNCYAPAPAAAVPALGGGVTMNSAFSIQNVLQQRSSGDGDESNNNNNNNNKDATADSAAAALPPSRSPLALRRLVMETSVLSQAAGSALIEWGHTKVLCQVHGPLSSETSGNNSNINSNNMDEGTLVCDVRLAPNLGMGVERMAASQVSSLDQYHQTAGAAATSLSSGKQSNLVSTRETHLASQLYTALSSAVPLTAYPKCQIVVNILVLQDDGNLISACITAASLALADACMEMNDLVTCCRVALVIQQQPSSSSSSSSSKRNVNNAAAAATPKDNTQNSTEMDSWVLLADPDQREEDVSTAMVTLCVLPNWKQVTLWEQSGRMSTTQLQQAMELCRDGCRTLHRFMRTCLVANTVRPPRASTS